MNNVEFEGGSYVAQSRQTLSLSDWLIAKRIVQTKERANMLLLFLALVFCTIAVGVLSFAGSPRVTKKPQFREDITPEARAKLPPGVYETIPSKYETKTP